MIIIHTIHRSSSFSKTETFHRSHSQFVYTHTTCTGISHGTDTGSDEARWASCIIYIGLRRITRNPNKTCFWSRLKIHVNLHISAPQSSECRLRKEFIKVPGFFSVFISSFFFRLLFVQLFWWFFLFCKFCGKTAVSKFHFENTISISTFKLWCSVFSLWSVVSHFNL